MFRNLRTTTIAALFLFSLAACQKDANQKVGNGVSAEIKAAVKELGFSDKNILSVEGGYVVEGDIFISKDDVSRNLKGSDIRVGESEQYHTTNLVTVSGSRVINVLVDPKLPASYFDATDIALKRYNDQG